MSTREEIKAALKAGLIVNPESVCQRCTRPKDSRYNRPLCQPCAQYENHK